MPPSLQKSAVAVAHVKRGKGLIKLNGEPDVEFAARVALAGFPHVVLPLLCATLVLLPLSCSAGTPLDLIQPEILRWKVKEPINLLGVEHFQNLDIRIRVRGGGHVSQAYAIRQAVAKARRRLGAPIARPAGLTVALLQPQGIVAFYQKFVDEESKRKVKEVLTNFDRTLLVADPRRAEPKKFGGRGARARYVPIAAAAQLFPRTRRIRPDPSPPSSIHTSSCGAASRSPTGAFCLLALGVGGVPPPVGAC